MFVSWIVHLYKETKIKIIFIIRNLKLINFNQKKISRFYMSNFFFNLFSNLLSINNRNL